MKKRDFNPKPSALEKQLLAVFFSGFYLTHKDIVKIGKRVGIELPYKKRAMILQELFIEAKNRGKYREVILDLIKLIDENIAKFRSYLESYPDAASIVNTWVQKASATKGLLLRELRGNPYE